MPLLYGVDAFGLGFCLLISSSQLLHQPGFGWRGEKRHDCRGTEDGIKIHPRPNLDGRLQAEEDERRCGEAEGQLGRDVGDYVVIGFISGRTLTVRREKKRADVSAKIFFWLA